MKLEWTHAVCYPCWEKRFGYDPHKVLDGDPERCCFCGGRTCSGIYVRHDPRGLKCEGVHHVVE